MKYSDAHDEAALFMLQREQQDMTVVARFTIDGEPVSKARARFTGYGSKVRSYTPAATLTAEARVRAAFKRAAPHHMPDTETTYGVTALFFCGNRQRRDVDNMLKLILDGLNTVAWPDDVQVVEVSGRKSMEIPEHARTEVVIYLVGGVQRLIRTCEHCGGHFDVFPGNKRRFCSRSCAYDNRKIQDRKACVMCGKPIARSSDRFCSRSCMGESRKREVCPKCGGVKVSTRAKVCRSCWNNRSVTP